MMKSLRKKLADQSGASLMVALLFFIICAVVGSSILAAASSSMGRLKDIYQTDQERNTLSSAANLIAEKFGQEYDFSDFEDAYVKTLDDGTKVLQSSLTYEEGTEMLPAVPSKKADSSQTKDLAQFTKDLASKYITDHWGNFLTGWTNDQMPDNRTVTDYKQADGESAASVYTKAGSYTFSLPGHTDDGRNNEIAAVDIYTDQYMNIEVHIYPYKQYKDTSVETFKNARQRYLVKIPAKAGEIQYEQIPSADADGKRTVKRTITISHFGWDKAEIYTGSLVEVERNAPEE